MNAAEIRVTRIEDQTEAIKPDGHVLLPGMLIPSYRAKWAKEQGIMRNILLSVNAGGLGDRICAEPMLRYATETLKGVDISLVTHDPELFAHLRFKKVYNLDRDEIPDSYQFYKLETMATTDDFIWDFLCHLTIHCVDYPALCAFRCQLPQAYREIHLKPHADCFERIEQFFSYRDWRRRAVGHTIVLHPGKHWQSKTFPAAWWNEVIARIQAREISPVLIGHDGSDNTGTVDVDARDCLDLRNRLSVMESVALLQTSPVLLTNDSSPLHMAASGNAWIGYVTLAKHPDYLTHTRRGIYGYRMRNFERGGIWELQDVGVNAGSVMDIGNDWMEKWLPSPGEFAEWGIKRCLEQSEGLPKIHSSH